MFQRMLSSRGTKEIGSRTSKQYEIFLENQLPVSFSHDGDVNWGLNVCPIMV